jgi:hypothetical protein
MFRFWRSATVIGLVCVLMIASALVGVQDAAATRDRPARTRLHYAANSNFAPDGRYLPGRYGFNLADVSTVAQLASLPRGVRALVYLGLCDGADQNFVTTVGEFSGNRKVFGYYLIDDPLPAACPAANLEAESSYIHEHVRGARTFILEQNLAASTDPSYVGGYNPDNTGIDLFGIDPYPCRTELGGCDPTMIASYVAAAEQFGIPRSSIIPVFQAFGGGTWVDDAGGSYQMPTAAELRSILGQWARLVPSPVFDFTYSWGSQRDDTALSNAPADARAVLAAHNDRCSHRTSR